MTPPPRGARGPLDLDQQLVNHLIEHRGVCARSDLNALGLSGSVIDRRIASGLLMSFGGGAIALTGFGDPSTIARRAALIQRPDAVLARETAASLHRFPLGGVRSDAVVLLTTADQSGRTRFGQVFRTKHLPPDDITTIDGLRVTTPERTYLDLANQFAFGRMRWLGEQLLIDNLLSVPTLSACASSLARRGRKGTRFRRFLLGVLLDQDPIHESVAERTFARLCHRHGIQSLHAQFVPPWYDGLRGVVDFADPLHRKIIEVDGRRWHSTTQDRMNDRTRDRTAKQNGWQVIRFGYDEIIQRPSYVVAELQTFLDQDHVTPARRAG